MLTNKTLLFPTLLTLFLIVVTTTTTVLADLVKQRDVHGGRISTQHHLSALKARSYPEWEELCGQRKDIHCLSLYGTTLTVPQFDKWSHQIVAQKPIPGGHIYALKEGPVHVRADCDSHDVYHNETSIAWINFGKHTIVNVQHRPYSRLQSVLTGDLMDKPKAPKLKTEHPLSSWYPGVDLQLYCASKASLEAREEAEGESEAEAVRAQLGTEAAAAAAVAEEK